MTLFIFGLAIALGRVYPRWVGLIAAVSGAAFMYNGAVVVAYEGFVPSIVKLVGLLCWRCGRSSWPRSCGATVVADASPS